MNPTQVESVKLLEPYSTCELGDALQKLGISSYIINSTPISPADASNAKMVGPAHTVEFVPISDTVTPVASSHHVDILPEGHVMVIAAPPTHPNAVWGGLMTARAKMLGSVGVIVDGRVRDVNELREAGFPVFATRGTSVLGAAGYVRPVRVGEPVVLCRDSAWPVLVNPGDFVVADVDGAVRVPAGKVEEVVRLAKEIREVDAKCLADINLGATIVEAFKTHRGKNL
ncbi:hypothetical protein HDU97_008455 [Phlyctochytrium planicorne]|nr:hypothetical protein HDU97_008455 [Phlyctochytrium planicorne]